MSHAAQDLELGIYCHVPFCAVFCDYCSFYKESPTPEKIENYLLGIEKEIELFPQPRIASTFFIGGGTPGVLSISNFKHLSKILLKNNFDKYPKEWTVELTPATAELDKLKALKDLGVSRISLGVQSFDENTLKIIGRKHTPASSFKAIEIIQKAGFDNYNIDLIFSIPGEPKLRWENDLEIIKKISPPHISAYCLILDECPGLKKRLAKNYPEDFLKKNPTTEAEIYLKTWHFLESLNYEHYETANFCKKGFHCQHNLNTWEMHEWIGYGPAAASQIGLKRFANPNNMRRWINNLEKNILDRVETIDLTQQQLFLDSIIFGLRLSKPLDIKSLAKRFLITEIPHKDKLLNLAEKLNEEKYITFLNNSPLHWQLNDSGKLLADAIAEEILLSFDD